MKAVIAGVVCGIAGATIAGLYVLKKMASVVDKEASKSFGNQEMSQAMIRWVRLKQKGYNLSENLKKRGYKKVAIYGMAAAGEALLEELQNDEIEVSYGIDQNAKNMYAPIPLYTPNDELPSVDAIIVTPLNYFDDIEATLTSKVDYPILSIEDLMLEE